MSATLSHAQRLKFGTLAEGVEISDGAARALREINGERRLTPADYASTTGVILELEDDVWVNAPVNAHNPNFVSDSPYRLDHGREGFIVVGRGLQSTARFWPPPKYHGTSGAHGPLNNSSGWLVSHKRGLSGNGPAANRKAGLGTERT